jgi:hypothetical protein
MGIEPTAQAWEAWVLPLYDARYSSILIRSPGDLQTALQRRHRAPRQWGAESPGPAQGGARPAEVGRGRPLLTLMRRPDRSIAEHGYRGRAAARQRTVIGGRYGVGDRVQQAFLR